MSYGALGLVEVVGSCNAVVVLDQMLKTSDVEFRTWHTKCGGHATIFLSGDIAAVKAAVDAVKGNPPCEIIAAAVISDLNEKLNSSFGPNGGADRILDQISFRRFICIHTKTVSAL